MNEDNLKVLKGIIDRSQPQWDYHVKEQRKMFLIYPEWDDMKALFNSLTDWVDDWFTVRVVGLTGLHPSVDLNEHPYSYLSLDDGTLLYDWLIENYPQEDVDL